MCSRERKVRCERPRRLTLGVEPRRSRFGAGVSMAVDCAVALALCNHVRHAGAGSFYRRTHAPGGSTGDRFR
jgi:hypothetical protein